MLHHIKKVFRSNNPNNEEIPESAYKEQLRYLSGIWHGHTYGIERLFRFLLCLVQFIYPTLLIRTVFGRFGKTSRRLALEFYILLKVILPVFVLSKGLYQSQWVIWFVIYLLSETIFHLLNLIFLSESHSTSISYLRSVLLLFLNYAEVLMAFAIIYAGFGLLNKPVAGMEAVYFSFVTQATLGYGDIFPIGGNGQIAVIIHLAIVLLFALVFINYFTSKAGQSQK